MAPSRTLQQPLRRRGKTLSSRAVEPTHFTPREVQSFKTNGYLAGPRVLSDEQIARLLTRIDEIVAGRAEFPDLLKGEARGKAENNPPSFKIVNLFRHDPVFFQVYQNRTISRLTYDLVGEPVRLWEDQVILKQAYDQETALAWHQDYRFWDHVGPANMLTCWIALDDASVANGAMHVIPGSHLWTVDYTRDEIDVENPEWLLQRDDLPTHVDRTPVPCEVKAGHCHFHHCMTFHGSYGNRTDNLRRSYVLHLMPASTRRIGQPWNPRMAQLDDIPIGGLVQGPDYPELPAPVG